MAMAGYQPKEAIPFWERMKGGSGGSSVPEFLSTHPNPENRVFDIKNHKTEQGCNGTEKLGDYQDLINSLP
jgi:predicted Zn-dependent protease